MEVNWFSREYSLKDKNGVFALRTAVYGTPFDEKEWAWKFESKISKESKIFVAESAGKIIGLRPVIFVPLKTREGIKEQGLNVDVMTHPDFRRLGIFSKLVREAYDYSKKEGTDFIFTFPNHNSFPSYRKLGWTHICSIPLLVFPLKDRNIVKKIIKSKPLMYIATPFVSISFSAIRLWGKMTRKNKNVLIQEVRNFDSRYDKLWQECSSKYDIAVVRDSKYLNWRYANKPGEDYIVLEAQRDNKLVGYMVLKSNIPEFNLNLGLIVDIQAIEDESVIGSLLAATKEFFQKQNVDCIGCLMLRHTNYFASLQKAGFIAVPRSISPKEFYFVGHTDSPKSEYIYNSKNWFLTFGDIDIT